MPEINKELEKSVKMIPSLVGGIKALIATMKFSAEDKMLDGSKLILPEKIEIAEKVVIKEGEEEIPAPDGKYKFEDSKDIITIKNGVIKEIKKEEKEGGTDGEDTNEKFKDALTSEGKTLRYEGETPEIGLDIFVVEDTGQGPAPDGEYELENKTKLTVQGGKITNVTLPVEEEGAEEEKMAKVQELIEQLKSLGVTVETMKKQNEDIKKENEEIKKEHETSKVIMKNIFSVVETLAELPSTTPGGTPGQFSNEEGELVDIDAALKEYRANYKKLRQN